MRNKIEIKKNGVEFQKYCKIIIKEVFNNRSLAL